MIKLFGKFKDTKITTKDMVNYVDTEVQTRVKEIFNRDEGLRDIRNRSFKVKTPRRLKKLIEELSKCGVDVDKNHVGVVRDSKVSFLISGRGSDSFRITMLPSEHTQEVKSWMSGLDRCNKLNQLMYLGEDGIKHKIMQMSKDIDPGDRSVVDVLDEIVTKIIQDAA